jgi:serine/threonine protein kinase
MIIGETFGSYEVSNKIGEGGMGEVYLGLHKYMGRKAAIKVLRQKYSSEPGELIVAHASEMPPLASKIQRSTPPEMAQLIASMLAKRPEDRPQTMQEVATRLESKFRLKSYTEARRAYQTALDLDPDNSTALLHLRAIKVRTSESE